MCFVFSHTHIQCVTLATREGVLSSVFRVNRFYALVYVPAIRFKIIRVIYFVNHAVIGVICDVHFPEWVTNVWMGYCVEVDMYMVPELTSWSEKPVGASACPQRIFFSKILTPKYGGSFILAGIPNGSDQVNFRILFGPCFVSCV